MQLKRIQNLKKLNRREIPRGSHLRTVLSFVRLCTVRLFAHSRSGLQRLYFGDVPQGQDQALRKRLRHFFVPRRSRCRVPARRGDQSGGGIFLSDRLARKGAVRQAVFAFARVFGEGAQRTVVRRSAHRRGRLLCVAKRRHLAARAALPCHQPEIARKVHKSKLNLWSASFFMDITKNLQMLT